MASRNFYIQLIVRVLILTATILGLSFSVLNGWYFSFAFLTLIAASQVYSLIVFINRTNRKIAYFFDAIKNEDFTLHFPERVAIESFKDLNKSLNRVNDLIHEVHLQLQIREQYYQEILKQASIGIMTYNEKGHILFANPTAEKILDYTPLNHIKQLMQVDENLYRIFKSFKAFDRKLFQLSNEREQIQLALKSTPLTLDGQSLLLVVIQDIQRELDEKETESWVRLIRVLTHEIMNTITPIVSISDSIMKYYNDNGRVIAPESIDENQVKNTVKGLEVIKDQGGDLMEFVQSYRSLLHVPDPTKTLVNGQGLFDKINVLMSARLGDKIDLKVICEPEKLDFYIDEKQISQVLINLTKNALQSVEKTENGKVRLVGGIDKNGSKYIDVMDNGPGIPPEVMDEIFVPFFTTKNEGTGIGLSLSKRVMQLHGGSIQVRSVPHQETVFRLTFA
ncbi:sensor histidine kinase [Flagellimonas zhangzhouensis]|uniref:histidine kinase n=1 Tax=Flagellimonas zhangzhouensis TaxID=1073328 RepID=A0A1H2UXV9_9FLAO|nr:ATP-binding protein [Allomuricauda zhangzhouensis]SDQ12692.1 PAS domain-containing protein [Allomuricauda zhangzhouensis]SDW60848.1 PAS domain-containing protein [Allomuricauda zhangzhouensis]